MKRARGVAECKTRTRGFTRRVDTRAYLTGGKKKKRKKEKQTEGGGAFAPFATLPRSQFTPDDQIFNLFVTPPFARATVPGLFVIHNASKYSGNGENP